MNVTCTTPGCENEGIALEIADHWQDLDGTLHPVTVVQCGPCRQWIIPPPTEGEPHAPDPV